MPERITREREIFESVLPWLMLGILLAYTYAAFFEVPYFGFDFNPQTAEIIGVFIDAPDDVALRQNDILLRFGSIGWDAYSSDDNQLLFEDIETGETVPIQVQRGEQVLEIPWVIPRFNRGEFLDRLINIWWLAYIFWFFGTATVIFLRPRDTRRDLLIAAFYLTAVWLISGNLSAWRVWRSSTMLHATMWLYAPVILHLHWIFPKPFRKIPNVLFILGYSIAVLLAVGEWFHLLPHNLYFFGFILAVAGTIILLIHHYIFHPNYRREVGFLIVAAGVAFVPSIAVSAFGLLGLIPRYGPLALLTMPVLPGAYFYIAYRSQLEGMELRANRLVSAYLFITILVVAFFIIIPIVNARLQLAGAETIIGISTAIIAALLSIFAFPGFNRFVERSLLGIPLPPTDVLENHSARIATSLATPNLVGLLKDEVLPSLMVRQSALLRVTDDQSVVPVYIDRIDTFPIPNAAEIASMIDETGGDYRARIVKQAPDRLSWVRLAIPLDVEGKLIGVWLLGQHDPDNLYTQAEVSVLQVIADQVALALENIDQAERLRLLFEANIERGDDERAALARELHDDILNQIAILATTRDRDHAYTGNPDGYQTITDRIRRMISGLRPSMLTYGLGPALDELVDDLSERVDDGSTFLADVQPSAVRYDLKVEEHLYRIVQQACENAIRHARAGRIHLHGRLEPCVDLIIEDDGVGLPEVGKLDLQELLAQKRYGLVGLMERAEIIEANLEIDSSPDRGTKVHVVWEPDKNNIPPA